MNTKQRKRISELIDELDDMLRELRDEQDAEETKFDNLPEGLQESERGELIQDAVEHLEEATSCIESAIDELNEIVNS